MLERTLGTMASQNSLSDEPAQLPSHDAPVGNSYCTSSPVGHEEPTGSTGTQDCCWSVPATMAAAAFLCYMPTSWLAILTVYFVHKFEITRQEASWPRIVASMVGQLSALAVYALQMRMKTYNIILFSTVLCAASLIFSTFSQNITCMTMTLGILLGFGQGIFLTSSQIYTLFYFSKYRAFATSIINVAFAISGMVSPFVLSGLEDAYFVEGALLIYGGIMLNSTIIIILAKNPSQFTDCASRSHPNSAERGTSKSTHFVAVARLHSEQRHSADASQMSGRQESASFKQVGALFRMPALYVLVVTLIIADLTTAEFYGTVVDYARDRGLEPRDAEQLVTFVSLGALLGGLSVPLLTDCVPFIRCPAYAVSLLAVGGCQMVAPYLSGFTANIMLALLVGAFMGFILCSKPVLLAESFGIRRTAACLALIGVIRIPVSLVCPLLIGHFRDSTGSYDGYYRMLGGMSVAAALLFSAHYIFSRGKFTADEQPSVL
ncbi:monocarboxylate transporter 12-like isoform X2 [Dermacentor silvarum]|uniref:monocarboxylate transporter 12-like isoform X2 n=1 Tax=Dermacentor silvarum TaxID=543639 RepID=UPI00210155B7|nr:monocarboxylate transporter 12-like isoform X2 [Dermacentor silvarum]